MSAETDEDRIVAAVRARAADPSTRIDDRRVRELPPTASEDALDAAEARLGTRMHPFHRRLLAEVADGAFGPGFGIVGLVRHGDDPSLLDRHERLRLPVELVPLCDWGCGTWSAVDAATGRVITVSEELTDTGETLIAWMAAWAAGRDLAVSLFDEGPTVTTVNPFTKKPMTVRGRGRRRGIPYRPRQDPIEPR